MLVCLSIHGPLDVDSLALPYSLVCAGDLHKTLIPSLIGDRSVSLDAVVERQQEANPGHYLIPYGQSGYWNERRLMS